MTPPGSMRRLLRAVFVVATFVVLLCMPWVWAAETFGWSQRPAHLLQGFVAVPAAFVASGIFLCLRAPAEAPKWERRAAWAVFVLAGVWLAVLVWVFIALAQGMFPRPA